MNILRSMPLTDTQTGIYLECVNREEALQYNITFEYAFPPDTDEERLRAAFDRVAANYAAFACGVLVREGQPELVQTDTPARICPCEELTEAAYAARRDGFARPFRFDGTPLCRAALYRTEEQVYLLMDIHHLVYDGVSTNVFDRALETAWLGQELKEESVTPFDAAPDPNAPNEAAARLADYDYFATLLGGVETDSNLLPDRAEENTDHCRMLHRDLGVDRASVRRFAAEQGVTENVVLLAAFTYTLAKYTGQTEALFASVESGRRNRPLGNTVGFFVRTFPLYYSIDETSPVGEYLAAVRDGYFASMRHDGASFAELAGRHGIRADIKYVYQGELINDFTLDARPVRKTLLDCEDALSNLDVMLCTDGDRYRLQLDYRDALYSEENILCFADMFSCVANGILRAERLRDIPLVTDEIMRRLDRFNATERPYDRTETAWSILSERIREGGDRLAVRSGDTAITYAEFDDLTARLAACLRGKGIGHEDFVAVLIPRNEFMPVTAWGIVRAGAAYQPLDPSYPKERLNFMVRDAGVRLVIADRALRPMLDEYEGDVLYTDELASLPPAEDTAPNDRPEVPLVLIYTSGTTGTPKGCILENRNIVCLYHNHIQIMGMDSSARVATYASFGFDACIMDIFTTLMVGGGLYVLPDELRLDLHQMDAFFCENGITHGAITTQVGRMFAEMTTCPTLKALTVGGEKLVPFQPSERFRFINGYGPSEASSYVCSQVVTDDSSLQPIGVPNGNTKLYVVDGFDRMLPPGASGELCIAGIQVSRGYLNRPEKTAEVFVPNPFTEEEGYERMYRTGDVVRRLPDGRLDFVGRRDAQVKIRGFRVELTEVEQVIRSFPPVQNATVQAFDAPVGGKFIAAYVVAEGTLDVEALNAFIRAQKPDYMVPEFTIQLYEIPLTVNSKVDKRALPVPQHREDNLVLPQNDVQQRIFDRVAEVIGHETFGIETDLFGAGLTSIGVIRLNVLLAEEFGVSLTLRDLRRNETISKLERHIRALGGAEEKAAREDYPLTKTQEGIYIECLTHPGETQYNVPLLLRVDSALEVPRLKEALAAAVNAHGYLQTRLFTNTEGAVRQERRDDELFTPDDITERRAASIEELRARLLRPFTLLGERLFRIELIHADGLYLYLDVHHILADGASINLFLRDVGRAYAGETLKKETFTGYDVAAAEAAARSGAELAQARAHYETMLAGLDTDFLPKEDRSPSAPMDSGALERRSDEQRRREVERFCAAHGVGVNGLMLSVFGYVLGCYHAGDYAVFTTVYNGRGDSRTADTVSMLVKTLPVCVRTEDTSPLALVKSVSAQLLESMVNDLFSFAEVSHDFGVQPDVMFIYQGSDFGFERFCGRPAQELPVAMADKKMPLSLQVYDDGTRFVYKADYDNTRYTEGLIGALVDAFDCALGEFTRREFLREVSFVTDETARLLDRFNATERPYDRTESVWSILSKRVRETPDRLAVRYKDTTLTYAELEDITARLAARLHDKGIGRGDYVAVLIPRNEFMPVTAWGVVRAGAAYQPLDPSYPKERLNFMVRDAGVRLVIADRALRPLLDEYEGDVLYTDELASLPRAEDNTPNDRPEDPLVLIYTSGTTGTPKGCILENRNIVCFHHNHARTMGLDGAARVATYASFGFDAGIMDIFTTLMAGAGLYIVPDELRLDLRQLDAFYCENGITHGFITTQMGRMFAEITTCPTLKTMLVGGEKLVPFTPPERFRFINGYGPSETIAYVCHQVVTDGGSLQPIGVPSGNTKLYVADGFGRLLPPGGCGELCVAGGQVGRGYLNRPEKTAEAFTPNPYTTEERYERLYHTGDLVRRLPDGRLDFVGRRDAQIKIRGFRVELTEVEQVIRAFPSVRNASVQAFDAPGGGKYIAAYVVAEGTLDTEGLKAFIRSQKPNYMVPEVITQLDKIPLNANGKVDKRALPVPERAAAEAGIEPQDEIEESFCDIFGEVLGLDKVYANEDFFALGGSSISAAQAVVKCDSAGYNIVFKNFFENPTPQKLAAFVRGAKSEDILAPAGSEKEKYDYSCLEYNVTANLPQIRSEGVGDVLLTGVTGFLGSHVYRALMEKTDGSVVCLVRSKNGLSAADRFQLTMTYYFEDWYGEAQRARTVIVDGDLADEDIDRKLEGLCFDTIINNAANVKHFAEGDRLVRDNYESVEHLIALAERRGARLVQASSLSVCGESVNGSIPMDFRFREYNLNIGQSLENKYVYSKYLAEQAIIDATSRGRIRGKIIRLGNLAARDSDGEYQINASNSGLMKLMQGYIKLGCYPVDMLDAGIEFSPIDKVAEALVLLAGTPDRFTVFHAKNCHEIHYAYFIQALRDRGYRIDIVEREIFEERFKTALDGQEDITAFTGFIAYLNRTDGSVTDLMVYSDDEANSAEAVRESQYETRVKVTSDTAFTTKALYRLGFSWPLTGKEYLENMVSTLDDKAFF